MEIIFNEVSYTYNIKTSLAQKAIDTVSCKIPRGNITGIIGPTGSGKTTLIELITALLNPHEGYIKLNKFKIENNKQISNINNLRSKLGLMFQFPEEQFFQPTVKKELEFGMKYFNYKLPEIDKRINQALKMVGLDESYLERNPFELSHGEKRKVALASILVFNPKVVILDEPTVGLDNRNKKRLVKLIRRLKLIYHKTIIIVSHDVDLLYVLADYIVALNKGKLVTSGSKYDVFSQEELLTNNNIDIPKVANFTNKVLKRQKIKLGNYCEINDLIKAIYRHV
ncbi:MAG: ATP-binding cassette domain-containing protein [Bacilli bacterium]|jgi:energy-coupling factor transport system ATP-binding protein|nr:ATP-binding cassette domain-containing protein [Bacilli bacterium]